MKPLELIEQGRFLGEEFLVWLWHRSLNEGGASGVEGDSSALFVDDRLVVVSERGDVKEISLAKGNPAESREAFEALSRGMRPAKLKVRILCGDMEFVGNLDASTLRLTTLKMPPTSSKDMQSRLADRIYLMEMVHDHLDRRFKAFLAQRVENPEGMQETLQSWLILGLSGALPDAPRDDDEAPAQPAAAATPTAAKDPAFRKAVGGFLNTLAKAGAGVTIETSEGRLEISPEDAARAARRIGAGS